MLRREISVSREFYDVSCALLMYTHILTKFYAMTYRVEIQIGVGLRMIGNERLIITGLI